MQSFVWEKHANAVVEEVAELFRKEENIDCTFLVEGQYVTAHKVILCACSPYFQELFKSESGKKAVSLKGIKYNDFKCILNFIYYGIVDIPLNQVVSFISTTKLLQIRGLEGIDKTEKFGTNAFEDEENQLGRLLPGTGSLSAFDARKIGSLHIGGGRDMENGPENDGSSPVQRSMRNALQVKANNIDNRDATPKFHYVDVNDIPIKCEARDDEANQTANSSHEDEESFLRGEVETDINEEMMLKSEDEEEIVVECSLGVERTQTSYHENFADGISPSSGLGQEQMYSAGDVGLPHPLQLTMQMASSLALPAGCSDILRQHLLRAGGIGADVTAGIQRGSRGRGKGRGRGRGVGNARSLGSPAANVEAPGLADASGAGGEGTAPGQTREKPYGCHLCPVSFDKHSRLREHYRTHTGEKPFKCHLCPQDFGRRDNLKNHLRIHEGVKPFACPHCNAAFARNDTLKEHLRTHTGERPFLCPHCPQTFAQRSYFNCHLRTHLGQPFACEQCDAKFKFKHHLKAHLLTHTNEKAFACALCPAAFKRSEQLKRHTLKQHR